MEKFFILEKAMVKKIVAATGAVLVLQWAYEESWSRNWNAMEAEPWRKNSGCRYHLALVVPESDQRIDKELQNAVERLQPPGMRLVADICRQKAALRAVKMSSSHFSQVYRLGSPLYNKLPRLFPAAGAGCRHPT